MLSDPSESITDPRKKLTGSAALNTLPLANLHLNPALRIPEVVLDRFGASSVVPRSEVDVPVAPEKKVREDQLFETTDGAFYLPRYKVAEETVSGEQRVRVQLREKEQGGELEVILNRIPPESMDDSTDDIRPIDHQLDLVLRYDRNGVQEEHRFQEKTRMDQGVRAVLTVGDAMMLYELQNALSHGGPSAELVVRRTIRIAVPAEAETDDVAQCKKEVADLRQQENQIDRRRRQLNRRLERTREHWQELGPEDCISYDPDNLKIKDEGDHWLLTDGRSRMLILKNEEDARRALALVRRHTQHCFIGRGSDKRFIVEYWKGRSAHHPAELEAELEKVKDRLQSVRQTRQQKEEELARLREQDYVRVTSRTFDQTIPFSFPSNLGYIFPDFSGQETETGWIHHTVNGHSYYQDAADRRVFKYLPDEFRLARRPEPPYYPALWIQVHPAEQADSKPDVELTYLAVPYVDTERLEADREALRSELPPDGDEPELKPLYASKRPTFRLRLPDEEGFTERPEASVHLRDGIDDTIRMPLQKFRSVFQSMMSGSSRLFQGEVLVEFGDIAEKIGFNSTLEDMVGEVFEYHEIFDEHRLEVRLTSAIESPLELEEIEAWVGRTDDEHAAPPASIEILKAPGGGTDLPVELAPGEMLALNLRSDELPPGDGEPDATFDYTVKQKPDPEAIWETIVDRTVEPSRKKTVEVKTMESVFEESTEEGSPAIAYILVQFEQGQTVELSPETLEQTVSLSFPVREFVLSGTNGEVLKPDYAFTVRVIYEDGSEASGSKQTSKDSQVFVTTEYLP